MLSSAHVCIFAKLLGVFVSLGTPAKCVHVYGVQHLKVKIISE